MAQSYAPLLQQMMQEFQAQRLESAERLARSILRVNPKDLVALQVQGLCMAMQGRVAESIEPFTKAAALDSKNPELLINLAKAQHGSNLFAEAAKTYERLNRLVPNNAQLLTDMGTSYAKGNEFDRAFAIYDRAIELQPDYFLVWSNRGNLLAELSFNAEALVSYEKSLELNPNYPEAWTNYGNALFNLARYAEAASAHQRALSLDPNYAEAWSNHGNALLELKMGDEAYESYQKAFAIKPLHPYLMGQLLTSKLTSCIWDEQNPTVQKMLDAIAKDIPASIPFALLQTPAGLDLQKRCAQMFIADRHPKHPSFDEPLKRANENSQIIKIGYFSSDFKNHPVGILMQNLIQHHDRSKFQIIGFFLNSKSGDVVEKALLEQFDASFDLFGLNDVEAKDLILEQGIDIAVDLNGHTAGARTSLFARKVAPVQLNYLGYAGTSGSDFYDGLIADSIAINPDQESYFTEKILRLPHSFFPLDTSIHPDAFGELPTRESQGLPDSGFVFSCFNNPYKINPDIFQIWMRLLISVPDSVLWLSKASDKVIQNLKAQASASGVDPDRLVFAKFAPERKDHLSRLRLADLFLDTPHYNAHATAADALWAGVPVLTVIGDTFAGRIAASQLNAAGVPELIVQTNDQYFEKALELATNLGVLSVIRSKLEANRFTEPLFNSKRYAEDLERIFLELTKSS
jgi:protein O-GlcNAc transferase